MGAVPVEPGDERLHPADIDHRLAVRHHGRGRGRGEPRRDVRPQRRLHAVDDAPARGHQVPGRLGLQCRRRQVQHRHLPLLAAARAGVDDDRERRGVGHGRDGQRARRALGGVPGLLRGRVRPADVGQTGCAPCRTSHSARRAHRCTTRRWRPPRPTATRPSRSDSVPSRSSRTRRATGTASGPFATRTTGAAPTASPARTCPTSTPSRPSWPSTPTAAPTACAVATST